MKKKSGSNQSFLSKEKDKLLDQTNNLLKSKILKQEKLTSEDLIAIQSMINYQINGTIKQDDLDLISFFSDSIWNLQFEQQFLKKLQDQNNNHKGIIYHLLNLAEGHFSKHQEIQTKSIVQPFMKFYQALFYSEYNGWCIVFECSLRKLIKKEDKQIVVQFIHKMIIIDIIESEKNCEKQITESIQNYLSTQINFIDSSTINYLKEVNIELMVNKNAKTFNIEQLFKKNIEQNWSVLQFQTQKDKIQWYPNYFEIIKLQSDQLQSNLNQNLINDEKTISKIEQNKQQLIKASNQFIDQIFYTYTIEQIASILVKLSVMKNLTITQQEYTVLNQNKNALIIGRSGTGKTTCSILKILSMQILFMINQELGLFDQDKSFFIRIIFTTQNQILISEMRRFFLKLLKCDDIKQKSTESNDYNLVQKILSCLEKLQKNFEKWKIDQRDSLKKSFKPDYPAIISSNQFLMLIDNSLKVSFFKQFNIERKRIEGAGWQKNEKDHVSQIIEGVDSKLNQLKQDMNNMVQFQLHEIDFECFQEMFFSKFQKKFGDIQNETNFCNLLWSQIFSVIKGSKHSHCYPNRYLPEEIYLIYPQQLPLQKKIMQQIYSYFLIYEKWKSQNNYFDLMDLVNYIIEQIKLGNYLSQSIHYLFVDEVQDFTQATLYLFFLLAESKINLSGDTAQTIIKGVSFKFQDLKQIFHGVKEFETFALTVNFRSKNEILQLANSIISMIEILFPKSIDFLKKEQSQHSGPKPVVIQQKNINSIIYLLQGQTDGKIEFGCYQAVITKKGVEVPEILKHLISLNIQECKGLEFDDVILFNFFDDSKHSQKLWDLLKMINVEKENDGLKLRGNLTLKQFDTSDYSALCEELKYLYVAVTRARKRIFIFDQNSSKRRLIEQFWDQLGLVQIITLDDDFEKKQQLDQVLINKNSVQEWYEQGMKLFQLKYYEQAAKCFRYAKDTIMENYSIAFQLASQAQAGIQDFIQNKQGNNKNNEILQKEKQVYYNLFSEAGDRFLIAQKKEYAADCYFSGYCFDKALNNYLQIGNWNSAAMASDKLNLNFLSGLIYWKSGNIEKCLREFEIIDNPYQFLAILKSLKQKIGEKLYYHKFHQWFPKLIKNLETQINLQYMNQLEIIYENIPNYQVEFKIIQTIKENSYISTEGNISLMEIIFQYAVKYLDEILLLLTQIHINFNQQSAKEIILYQQQNQAQFQIKIQILQDIFQYYKLEQYLVLLQNSYNISTSPSKIFIKLYDSSLVYQKIINNSKIISEASDELEKTFESNLKNWNFQNYLQPIYQLSQIGFNNLAIKLLQNIMLQQVPQQQIRYLEEDYQESNYLFFQLNFLQGFDFITSILDFYLREQRKKSDECQKIIDQYHIQFKYFFEIQQSIISGDALKSEDLEYIFNVLSPIDQVSQTFTQSIKLIVSILMLQIIFNITKNDKSKLKEQFQLLNHTQFLNFIRFIQVCIDIFKYNKDLKQQFVQFYAICCVFSLRIPSKLTFSQLAQSFTFIHKESLIFQLNLLKFEQCDLIDNQENVYICYSQTIINILSNYLKQFVLKYSLQYFVEKQKQIVSKAPILIQLYSFLILKSKVKYEVPLGIQKFSLYQEVYVDFFLEKSFKILIIDELFNLVSQCAEPKLIIIKRILSELSTYYYFKSLQEKNIQIMHQNIMIGLGIQNVAHEQNISIAFIKYLQQQQQSLQFLEYYFDYAEYLQMTNFCFTLQACHKYLEFHKKQKDLLQSQQIYKDLTMLTLILSCYNQSQNELSQILIPNSFMKLIQHNLVENYYEIKINKSQKEEDLNQIVQDQLFDVISNQIKVSQGQEYLKYLRLFMVIMLNVETLWEGLSDKLYAISDELEYEDQEQDFQILAELVLKSKKERQIYLSPQKFETVNIKFLFVDDLQIDEYLLKKKSRKVDSHFLDKMKLQYSEHMKNKFNNFYAGIHLLLFRPLSFNTGQITENSIEEKPVLQLFEKIDYIRRLLIQVLYSPIIDSSAHFLAVTEELRKLSKFEQELDCYISKNERKTQRKIEDPKKVLNDLSIIEQNIENWKSLNQQLNANLQKLEYSFIKQKEEEDEAFELLQQRINKIIS